MSATDRSAWLIGEQTATYEFPLHTKHGEVLQILLNATPRRDVDGGGCMGHFSRKGSSPVWAQAQCVWSGPSSALLAATAHACAALCRSSTTPLNACSPGPARAG